MKVTLLSHTPNALELLIFTKSTRLKQMNNLGLQEIIDWPDEKKMAEWKYMQGTIKSSWEFADYTFSIEGVSRAFTHQLVRHRIGTSFAQQSQRTVDMTGFEYTVPSGLQNPDAYHQTMDAIHHGYKYMVDQGEAPQDARGVLPTNVCTNIIFKANLRTLNGMAAERLCVKAQGEFQDVVRQLRERVMEVHPWAERALRVHCAQYGVCAFPGFTNCPIKGPVFNPETGTRYDGQVYPLLPATADEVQMAWSGIRFEAVPGLPPKKEPQSQSVVAPASTTAFKGV